MQVASANQLILRISSVWYGISTEHQQNRELTEIKGMKWMEIIKLRSEEKAPELLKGLLSGLTREGQPGLVEARLYRHASWETDWTLHFHWDSGKPEVNGTALGLRLAQALKEFGLVDHSIWIEGDEID
jgi:hypothetical protein